MLPKVLYIFFAKKCFLYIFHRQRWICNRTLFNQKYFCPPELWLYVDLDWPGWNNGNVCQAQEGVPPARPTSAYLSQVSEEGPRSNLLLLPPILLFLLLLLVGRHLPETTLSRACDVLSVLLDALAWQQTRLCSKSEGAPDLIWSN